MNYINDTTVGAFTSNLIPVIMVRLVAQERIKHKQAAGASIVAVNTLLSKPEGRIHSNPKNVTHDAMHLGVWNKLVSKNYLLFAHITWELFTDFFPA